MKWVRSALVILLLLIVWQLITMAWHVPPFILPEPWHILMTWLQQFPLLMQHALPTLIETVLGLFLAILLGASGAIGLNYFQTARSWLLPIVLVSQTLPLFAIAPLLVLWLGYGMAAKIVTTTIMLFFPILTTFYDGLRHTPRAWLELSSSLGATRGQRLWRVQIPSALPALATGIRVATATAPMGAIIGEWVGASRGLGYLLLNANARIQTDLMFAALLTLILMAFILYYTVDRLLSYFIFWRGRRFAH